MRAETKQAVALLRAQQLTCAVICQDHTYQSTARGVAPLLQWLEQGVDVSGGYAADKVVGAGAAYLYVLLGVTELYADVVSDPAAKILIRYGISLHYGEKVDYIRNRAGDGQCPIEAAVAGVTDPADALTRIRHRLAELKKE
ncbi:MAG: DUF1893 domain-containing protein [Clostridia bacterium]|nr:DUF1893 domain-containing protein [Clostridia bacterium]